MRSSALPLPVVHLVSAMTTGVGELWGKERAIETLMRVQERSGEVHPQLITFDPCALGDRSSAHGFPVKTLEPIHRAVPSKAFMELRRHLTLGAPVFVHTHGYKANILGRSMRVSGVPMRALISTCHGWIDETRKTKLYNVLDRCTAALSDIVTVTDSEMLSRFPRRARTTFVPNGIEDCDPATPAERREARAHFHLPHDRFIVGVLGRLDVAKGMLDVLEAARRTRDMPLYWAIAGSGLLESHIRDAKLPNVSYVGYVRDSARYLSAIDVFLQASHSEGLSLALLEAMRERLPIVATAVGSTAMAVRNMREAVLVRPGNIDEIIDAVNLTYAERDLTILLASAARTRFESAFRAEHQHRAFLELYLRADGLHE